MEESSPQQMGIIHQPIERFVSRGFFQYFSLNKEFFYFSLTQADAAISHASARADPDFADLSGQGRAERWIGAGASDLVFTSRNDSTRSDPRTFDRRDSRPHGQPDRTDRQQPRQVPSPIQLLARRAIFVSFYREKRSLGFCVTVDLKTCFRLHGTCRADSRHGWPSPQKGRPRSGSPAGGDRRHSHAQADPSLVRAPRSLAYAPITGRSG
jgi:hypothetical protein